MGLASIGVPSMILIVVLALIVFGPKKLPEIGKAAGQTLREFKDSTNDIMGDDTPSNKNENNKASSETESNA